MHVTVSVTYTPIPGLTPVPAQRSSSSYDYQTYENAL